MNRKTKIRRWKGVGLLEKSEQSGRGVMEGEKRAGKGGERTSKKNAGKKQRSGGGKNRE